MIRIFNDTHLNNKAGAHTTHQSSKELDKRIFDNAMKATRTPVDATIVHGGDLFDKFSNKEDVILQGMAIAAKCDVIVGANHDLSNRSDVRSSISVVHEVFDNVCMAEVNESKYEHFEAECGTDFTIIPHHSSQDLFDMAVLECLGSFKGQRDLLFLHCNYNSPFAQNDSSLNLTPVQAELLLERFKFIILAHEHNHRYEHGGRLVVTGNTHPTNFGDISDKFYWDYNPQTKEMYPTLVWSKKDKYLRLNVKQLLDGTFVTEGKDFIEIVGSEIDPEQAPEIAQAMQSIWQVSSNLLMLRNNVEYKSLTAEVVDKTTQLEDVTKAISKDLDGTDLYDLWVDNLKNLGE
jgi:hypothetical protein